MQKSPGDTPPEQYFKGMSQLNILPFFTLYFGFEALILISRVIQNNTLNHGKVEIMWSQRELFKLGQYKSQCVLALDIRYFPFGYFLTHQVLQISLSSALELITTVHCSLWKL